jgi:hypothetical protein
MVFKFFCILIVKKNTVGLDLKVWYCYLSNNDNKFVEDMSCPAGPPPDYETVVKQREEEENGLPTYSVVSI